MTYKKPSDFKLGEQVFEDYEGYKVLSVHPSHKQVVAYSKEHDNIFKLSWEFIEAVKKGDITLDD